MCVHIIFLGGDDDQGQLYDGDDGKGEKQGDEEVEEDEKEVMDSYQNVYDDSGGHSPLDLNDNDNEEEKDQDEDEGYAEREVS